MRHFTRSCSFLSLLVLATACGRPVGQTVSEVDADRPIPPIFGRFGAAEVLDVLGSTADNSRVPSRSGVSMQQFDAAVTSLDSKMRIDASQGRLKLEESFGRTLTRGQQEGLSNLQRGYELRVREGAIKLAPANLGGFSIVPTDGRYKNQGEGANALVFDGHSVGDEVDAAGEAPSDTPDHRIEDGRWSWSLSYRWWGVRLSVNHNFLNYLCYNTEWMLSRAGLPTWIKIIIRPLGCLLHGLDSGRDGSSISITWTGAFWYTP